ncbi:MAG TPA: protein kinase [Limnochordia bacterium]|nr:protein kinase [Limnochordia bacterium]
MPLRANGVVVKLGRKLADGGEAEIFAVDGSPELLAKLYRADKRTDERAAKLRLMLARPPRGAPRRGLVGRIAAAGGLRSARRPVFAWPQALLEDEAGRVVGFLMPRIDDAQPLDVAFNPSERRRRSVDFTWRQLTAAATELARAVESAHRAGYVIGDLNESNVLVRPDTTVCLVDCDSYQARDPGDGRLYRCEVAKVEYLPPEAQKQDLSQLERTPEHDLFALAVLIFQLLMEGRHPFANTERPDVGQSIEENLTPYFNPGAFGPEATLPVAALPGEVLPRGLRRLFWRAFMDGHERPALRPNALAWALALERARLLLRRCRHNPQHVYRRFARRCPWCARRARGLRDSFPPTAAQQALRLARRWDQGVAEMTAGDLVRWAQDERPNPELTGLLRQLETEKLHPEERLFRFLVHLSPEGAPRWHRWTLDRPGLQRLARAAAQPRGQAAAKAAIGRVDRALAWYAERSGDAGLRAILERWRADRRAYAQRVERLGGEVPEGAAETGDARTAGILLAARLSERYAARLRTRAEAAGAAWAERPGSDEGASVALAQLAREAASDVVCAALVVRLAPLSVRAARRARRQLWLRRVAGVAAGAFASGAAVVLLGFIAHCAQGACAILRFDEWRALLGDDILLWTAALGGFLGAICGGLSAGPLAAGVRVALACALAGFSPLPRYAPVLYAVLLGAITVGLALQGITPGAQSRPKPVSPPL